MGPGKKYPPGQPELYPGGGLMYNALRATFIPGLESARLLRYLDCSANEVPAVLLDLEGAKDTGYTYPVLHPLDSLFFCVVGLRHEARN